MQDDIINFAYRTFVWDSEASVKAHVHCVIIGFAKFSRSNKYLYDNGRTTVAENINRYLMDGDNILVRSRNKPLCDIPKMIYGNKPADGGNLIIEDEDLNEFIKKIRMQRNISILFWEHQNISKGIKDGVYGLLEQIQKT